MKVSNAQELAEAIKAQEQIIELEGTITGSPSITLPEGTTLKGGTLEFKGKGVRLSRNNTLEDITISTLNYEEAIYNDSSIEDAGVFKLHKVETKGQISIVAKDAIHHIRVEADDVFVREADVRGRAIQPHGFGVDVLQGGFTLWNQQKDSNAHFSATLHDIKVGTKETPVRGSGVFVAGYGDREGKSAGGLFTADVIETGDIYIDGGIAKDTPDKISAGVFVVSGAVVQKIVNSGTVTTYGQNDMVLDLWGETPQWIANNTITSYGASGIGFVNFGKMGHLEINAPIVTHGDGARGFNLYDGSIESASFKSIETKGNGSIGIQVSKPMGELHVKGAVTTNGSEGTSLVKGVQMKLKAVGVSIKEGADIKKLQIDGTVSTQGDDLNSVEVLEGARVREISINKIEALGKNSKRIELSGDVPEGSLR
ncbi:MAG: hypothetical protein Q4E22_00390 [Coriobacteriia bacterium]|nr:hypothetical protein [Coriobacteriia bacterium]